MSASRPSASPGAPAANAANAHRNSGSMNTWVELERVRCASEDRPSTARAAPPAPSARAEPAAREVVERRSPAARPKACAQSSASGRGTSQKSGASSQKSGDWWSTKRLMPSFTDET
jgi:hypothetical protein